MIGTTILHFQILEKLGEGGMGVVYKARDTRLDRFVAVKFLPSRLTGTEEERARFLQEAKAAATLNHANVCTVYGIEEFEGQQFIEMEFVDGTTLRERIGSSGLPMGEAITFATHIGEALREAHAKGIVHRDIKSENIMLTGKNQVKVMDFGLAKLKGTSRLTRTSSTIGTLAYMAPEQVQGGEVDARSDIFSFGVVVFEMLTGRMPFRGEHDAAMMYSILNEPPIALTSLRPDLGTELERIVERALEKDPEDRYQHVDDMVSELRRLQKKSGRVSRPVAGPVHGSAEPAVSAPAGPHSLVSGRRRARHRPRITLYTTAAIVVAGAMVASYVLIFSPGNSIRSMAVLPFVNQSADPELEFLSDGFTETLINRLSRLPGITMMSRSSAFRYKGSAIDPVEAGVSLDVQAVLTGRVLQRGDRISVAVELVDVRDHSHIWGEQYNRPSSDMLILQDEIAQEISRQLRVTLSGDEGEKLGSASTQNTEAYELYLKGRFHWNKRTKDGFTTAASYFRDAIGKDPGYALAYAGLADCYAVMPSYFLLPAAEAHSKARAAAQKAMELDPSLAEPYVIAAALTCEFEWEWEKGETLFRRAIALNPNYATAHQWFGEALAAMGRIEESISELRLAQQLDPLSPIIATSLAQAGMVLSRNDDAQTELQKALELDPGFPRALMFRSILRHIKGDNPGAIREMRTLYESGKGGDEVRTALIFLLGKEGRNREAEAMTRELLKDSEGRYVSPYLLAVCYTGMGNRDEAFRWLNTALRERSVGLIYMNTDLLLMSLRDDPRFNELLDAMKLKPLAE